MSIEQLKKEVAALSSKEQADLIAFALQLRYGEDEAYQKEINDRLNDAEKSHWLTPEEFERRLDRA